MKRNSNKTTKNNKNGGNKFVKAAVGVVTDVAFGVLQNEATGYGRNRGHLANIENRINLASKSPYTGFDNRFTPTHTKAGVYIDNKYKHAGRRKKSKRIRTRVRKTRKH